MICQNCGGEIPNDSLGCLHCAPDASASGKRQAHRSEDLCYSFDPMSEQAPEAVRRRSRKPLGIALCVLGVIFALCGILAVLAGLGLTENYFSPLEEAAQRAAASLRELLP